MNGKRVEHTHHLELEVVAHCVESEGVTDIRRGFVLLLRDGVRLPQGEGLLVWEFLLVHLLVAIHILVLVHQFASDETEPLHVKSEKPLEELSEDHQPSLE